MQSQIEFLARYKKLIPARRHKDTSCVAGIKNSTLTIKFADTTNHTYTLEKQPSTTLKSNPEARKMHSALKNSITPDRMTFWIASLTFILGSYLALISRFRLSAKLNLLFEWIGKDLQSIAEHFLASLAVPAAFIALAIAIKKLSKKRKHEKSKIKFAAYTLTRKWIIRNTKFSRAFEFSIIIAGLYILASLSWEIDQISEHRAFQWDQFSADIMGAAIFLAALLFTGRRRKRHYARKNSGAVRIEPQHR